MNINEIQTGLKQVGYIPTRNICLALSATLSCHHPLLIEGESGAGKTSLAYAVAKMLNLPVIRVTFYEGITADKILYDYDYQKQLLTIQAIAGALQENLKGQSIARAIDTVKEINFFERDFLLARPLLQSISGNKCVLILDEVDKASEEIEYALLEFLENYSLSIPQYGTISCPVDCRPFVFLTSNNYRQLSEALCRRCNYLYIPEKTKKEIESILEAQCDASPKVRKGAAAALYEIRQLNGLNQKPSVAEAVSWADFLTLQCLDTGNIDVNDTLFLIAKNIHDQKRIQKSGLLEKHMQADFTGDR